MTSRAGELLGEARRRARISQAELGRRAGVPRSVVNAYERGARQPSTAALDRLLGAMGYALLIGRARPDQDEIARKLVDVLELADALPVQRRGRLAYPLLAAESPIPSR